MIVIMITRYEKKFNLENYYLRQKKNTEEIYQQAVERTQILYIHTRETDCY
jgi:hypothetical protein